jgi:hypothetical protein
MITHHNLATDADRTRPEMRVVIAASSLAGTWWSTFGAEGLARPCMDFERRT